jgi:hypothetical protein
LKIKKTLTNPKTFVAFLGVRPSSQVKAYLILRSNQAKSNSGIVEKKNLKG